MPQGLRVALVPVGLALSVALGGLPAAAAPAAPAARAGAPETLAQSVAASGKVVDPPFAIDFVAVTWSGRHGPASVRFRTGNAWTAWQGMGEDGIEESGEFASGLVPGGDADAYQVRIPAGVRGARSVAMNTTDGPASVTTQASASVAAAVPASGGVVSRAGWGADEGIRTWDADAFHPVQKLTVHHTAGINDDPDPAATVRAIYRFHAIDRDWGDIGYQLLIDAKGTVYEGRYTDVDPATPAGFDADGDVVVGAHAAGFNSGNVGISMLGTYDDRRPTALAQGSLEQALATVAARSGISATGSSTYANPSNGATWTGPNILGHRDLGSTACPGGVTYALLPTLRQRVAQRIAGTLVADSTMVPPRQIVVSTAPGRARVTWQTAGDPSDTQLKYWPRGKTAAARLTPLDMRFVEAHNVLVTGLARGTYDYQMIDADKAGNRYVSGVNTLRVP